MDRQDQELFREIGRLLDRADQLEREEKAAPKKTISYAEFMRRRGTPID
jgi:hypothetical protein